MSWKKHLFFCALTKQGNRKCPPFYHCFFQSGSQKMFSLNKPRNIYCHTVLSRPLELRVQCSSPEIIQMSCTIISGTDVAKNVPFFIWAFVSRSSSKSFDFHSYDWREAVRILKNKYFVLNIGLIQSAITQRIGHLFEFPRITFCSSLEFHFMQVKFPSLNTWSWNRLFASSKRVILNSVFQSLYSALSSCSKDPSFSTHSSLPPTAALTLTV